MSTESPIPGLLRSQFTYSLPDDRIARFPVSPRHNSKLLSCNRGTISNHVFRELPNLLPENSLLVFNNSKVIPARMHFITASGAVIEIFLLEPVMPSTEMTEAMQAGSPVVWTCTIGNKRKWKSGNLLSANVITGAGTEISLTVSLPDLQNNEVYFSWEPANLTLAEVLQAFGKIPLPPYLKRELTDQDKDTYQTVYAKREGAVAAPTAGLHFTPEVFADLKQAGIKTMETTLHVGAGTFMPLKADEVRNHAMHYEKYEVSAETLEGLLRHKGPVISVGTTSARVLESLYWAGVNFLLENNANYITDKEFPYSMQEKYGPDLPAAPTVWEYLLNHPQPENIECYRGNTALFIMPGYKFRVINGLVTNFHQPESTLMLLVAALIGPAWKDVYSQALLNKYRFLSYGDSSLLLP